MGGMTADTQGDADMRVLPQWSPPLVGGMTSVQRAHHANLDTPQWSPPLVGGMTLTHPWDAWR